MTKEIKYRRLADLKKLPNNPRTIKKDDMERLKQSIKDNPDYFEARPIILSNRTGELVILAGNQRYEAAKALGMDEVPTFLLEGLTEAREREIIIRDNVSNGEWDMDALANDWDTGLLEEWGVEQIEIYNEEEIIEDKVEESDIPNEEEVVSKSGEIYQLGSHRVACGDSTNEELIDKLFRDDKARVIFSSPPYNMGKGKMYDKYEDNRDGDEYIEFNLQILDNWGKHHKGFLFWNTNNNYNNNGYYLDLLCDIKNKTKYKMVEMIHWDKSVAMPVGGKNLKRQAENIMFMSDDEHDIETIYYGDDGGGKTNKIRNKITNYWGIQHEGGSIDTILNTATYPVKLPARGIRFSSEKGDIVADPFLGTGTTLIACEQLGRICYGCEMDEKQVDVIRKRYWKFVNGREEGWQDGTSEVAS